MKTIVLNPIKNNYTQIQAALDTLKGVGGIVYLSSGTYIVSSPLKIWSNTELVGENKSVVIVSSSNLIGPVITAGVYKEEKVQNIGIKNLVVQQLADTGTSSKCIYLEIVENFIVDNVTLV